MPIALLSACVNHAPQTSEQMKVVSDDGGLEVEMPDPRQFDDLNDDELETTIVDIADHEVSTNDDNPFAALEKLPYGYQVIYVTWRVDSEVNSGGFYQYFYDTNAKFTFLAQRAFTEIGAPKVAAILSKAMLRVEDKMPQFLDPDRHPPPFDPKELVDNNPLVDFDNEFFDDDENLSALRVKYIRTHPQLFKPNTKSAS